MRLQSAWPDEYASACRCNRSEEKCSATRKLKFALRILNRGDELQLLIGKAYFVAAFLMSYANSPPAVIVPFTS